MCPPLVATWIKQIVATGRKVNGKVVFKINVLTDFLKSNQVPHVATFLETHTAGKKELEFAETDCIKQKK